MNKAQILNYLELNFPDEEIVLFDGLEAAFLGIANRFEPVVVLDSYETGVEKLETKGGTHRYFALYSRTKIIEGLLAEGLDYEQATEYISFNIEGAYVGESTPAILMDEIDGTGYL